MRTILAAACAATMSLSAGAASAATLKGDFFGSFNNVENADRDVFRYRYEDRPGSSYDGYKGLAWGYTHGVKGYSDTSYLYVGDNAFECELSPGVTHCDVGYISYYNAVSDLRTTDDDFDAQLRLHLDLDAPINLNTHSDYLDLNVRTTLNSLEPNSDFVVSNDWEQFFLSGTDLGDGYTLLGFALSLAGPGALDFPDTDSFTWTNEEEDYSQLVITALIEGPTPVPLPAAVWMLLASIGGIAAMKRRRKS
ncbi:MAG: VPLPA-CTERM sorting domain-containing protein [Roseobacter sp.]